MGMVTTAYRRFPKAHFGDWFIDRKAGGLPRGVWKALPSLYVVGYGDTVVEYLLNAVAWHDKMCKKILSTAGTTVAAQLPSILHWASVDVVGGILTSVDKTSAVPSLAMFALFIWCFSSMDVNYYSWQGLLAIERTWCTNSWSMCVFGRRFIVKVTNAYDGTSVSAKWPILSPLIFMLSSMH